MCLCAPCVCKCPQRPEEHTGSLGAGVTQCYKPPDMVTWNQMPVLCKNRVLLGSFNP